MKRFIYVVAIYRTVLLLYFSSKLSFFPFFFIFLEFGRIVKYDPLAHGSPRKDTRARFASNQFKLSKAV